MADSAPPKAPKAAKIFSPIDSKVEFKKKPKVVLNKGGADGKTVISRVESFYADDGNGGEYLACQQTVTGDGKNATQIFFDKSGKKDGMERVLHVVDPSEISDSNYHGRAGAWVTLEETQWSADVKNNSVKKFRVHPKTGEVVPVSEMRYVRNQLQEEKHYSPVAAADCSIADKVGGSVLTLHNQYKDGDLVQRSKFRIHPQTGETVPVSDERMVQGKRLEEKHWQPVGSGDSSDKSKVGDAVLKSHKLWNDKGALVQDNQFRIHPKTGLGVPVSTLAIQMNTAGAVEKKVSEVYGGPYGGTENGTDKRMTRTTETNDAQKGNRKRIEQFALIGGDREKPVLEKEDNYKIVPGQDDIKDGVQIKNTVDGSGKAVLESSENYVDGKKHGTQTARVAGTLQYEEYDHDEKLSRWGKFKRKHNVKSAAGWVVGSGLIGLANLWLDLRSRVNFREDAVLERKQRKDARLEREFDTQVKELAVDRTLADRAYFQKFFGGGGVGGKGLGFGNLRGIGALGLAGNLFSWIRRNPLKSLALGFLLGGPALQRYNNNAPRHAETTITVNDSRARDQLFVDNRSAPNSPDIKLTGQFLDEEAYEKALEDGKVNPGDVLILEPNGGILGLFDDDKTMMLTTPGYQAMQKDQTFKEDALEAWEDIIEGVNGLGDRNERDPRYDDKIRTEVKFVGDEEQIEELDLDDKYYFVVQPDNYTNPNATPNMHYYKIHDYMNHYGTSVSTTASALQGFVESGDTITTATDGQQHQTPAAVDSAEQVRQRKAILGM